ncbi:MAG: glycerol-3-phosphate dehydrogenase [Proteobacteria bacterium]|nr:glycerol-3-phosphate dehydrogenase [Pseudomonadota bacterium]
MKIQPIYDLIVIGGGINGAGIAADAAGRGLAVLLCEQNDLANATSSASSKLIHGGLRYLEYYDFSLVKSALRERKILYKTAPHLVKPMRFVVPYVNTIRSFWFIRLGLYLYDLLGASFIFKRSKAISLKPTTDNPLKRTLRKGFIYTDCFVDDARLVISNALRAKQYGAQIATRVKCVKAQRMQDYWQVHLQDCLSNEHYVVKAKALVNAAGPWVNAVIDNVLHLPSKNKIRLVKGSHIIVPKLHNREQAYVLQHKDARIVFVIPYLNQFSLIGTTDMDYQGNPAEVQINHQEKEYLCDIVSEYFHHPLKSEQIVDAWSGVRPLLDDSSANLSAINRGYKIEVQLDDKKSLPLINVFGGKLTTYRLLSEKVVDTLCPFFPQAKSAWTAKRALPGGDLPERDFRLFLETLSQKYPWLPSFLLMRYAQTYGTLTYELLTGVNCVDDLGRDFGHGLYEKEIKYLIEQEWAKTADDILLRRSKLGFLMTADEKDKVRQWVDLTINQLHRIEPSSHSGRNKPNHQTNEYRD